MGRRAILAFVLGACVVPASAHAGSYDVYSCKFGSSYHFQRASRGRFTFRIRLRPNDAYPYSRGVSGRMRVRVG